MTFVQGNSEKALLAVLRCVTVRHSSADAVPLSVPLGEFGTVLWLAREHTVLGIVASAATEGLVEVAGGTAADRQKTVVSLMQTTMSHRRSYRKFCNALADFARLMDSHGLRYVVFKGVAVARHYPVPYTRTMGDVDFYVLASDFNRAVEVIEHELQVEIEKEDIDKHFSFDYRGIRFEMHYQIETFGYGKHQRYFNRMIDGSISQGVDSFCIDNSETGDVKAEVSVLPPTEDLIVVFKHWFNHLLVEGVGLRQTTDLAVLLVAYKNKIDIAKLMTALERIGYLKAFRAMLAMMRRYFHLTDLENFCILNVRDEQYGDKLMTTVLESGNFGRKAYKNHATGKKKSMETATRALRHCVRFWRLAATDILFLIPRRIGITLKMRMK